jgi:GNAT superfamily N-acetyltransferase
MQGGGLKSELMKGIRLFIRPLTSDDSPRLLSFWSAEGRPGAPPRDGLIGFLLGDLVVSLAFEDEGEALRITDVWVARNLRRKRVARAMVEELDALARRRGATRLLVRPSEEFIDAFRRLGFADAGDGMLVRPVERVR